MELREQIQKIISKYVDGFIVTKPEGTISKFKVGLLTEHKESILLKFDFPFGLGVSYIEVYACEEITKLLGKLLLNLKNIENELTKLVVKEKNNDK